MSISEALERYTVGRKGLFLPVTDSPVKYSSQTSQREKEQAATRNRNWKIFEKAEKLFNEVGVFTRLNELREYARENFSDARITPPIVSDSKSGRFVVGLVWNHLQGDGIHIWSAINVQMLPTLLAPALIVEGEKRELLTRDKFAEIEDALAEAWNNPGFLKGLHPSFL